MIGRLIIYLLIWLVLMFVSLKGCIEPECCTDDNIEEVDDNTGVIPPAEGTFAIPTMLNSADVEQGADYENWRNSLIAEFNNDPTQRLEIYGHFYPDESAPDGFENMGFARAETIARMLQPEIPLDQIDRLARRLDGESPDAEARWEAGRSVFVVDMNAGTDGDGDGDGSGGDGTGDDDGDGGDRDQVIELDENTITIRFPFRESTQTLSSSTEEYLNKLAQRLQQTDERVSITGHTDNVSSDEFNMRLGQSRADFVKRRLVAYGAPADRITTQSEGESNPEATNSTSAGRAKNRRAEVVLMPN
ncbi:MAG: OmpA family protein [Bacteroidota bacterium]